MIRLAQGDKVKKVRIFRAWFSTVPPCKSSGRMSNYSVKSSLAKWLKAEFHGSCLKKVLAINEERTVDWYLQFQVPQKLECTFPKQVSFGKKKLLIDHALPFAPTRSNISRPPIEESMHDHWKNTASLAPAQKKNRSNCIAHLEDCFPSLQRVNMLQEISIRSRGLRIAGSFEISSTPLLFLNGVPELADGLQAFVSIVSNVPDIATDVDHSVERYLAQPVLPNLLVILQSSMVSACRVRIMSRSTLDAFLPDGMVVLLALLSS